MSNVLKFFVLFGLLSAVCCYNIRDDVPWVKERDRITDRFLVGMIKGRNTLCNGTLNGVQVEGVCVSSRECLALGGVRGGACSFLGTCCIVEKTCSNSTKAKLSYFVPGKVFQPDCSLNVIPINRDVCQLRLDFIKFSIARPTQRDEYYSFNNSYQCHHDAFTVSTGSKLGFLHLCGENTKQHIYVPVSNQNTIVLRFQLYPNRSNLSFTGLTPDWRIRIHQLECSRYHSVDINNIDSPLATMHHHHHHHHHHRPGYNSDYHLIAPTGCLQYYPQRSGTYESFNFQAGHGNYIGTTYYEICFKRTPDICGIRHTSEFFVMSYNVNHKDELECHPREETEVSQDYIRIPGGKVNNRYEDYYCDEMLGNGTTVTSSKPGPLSVTVSTDTYRHMQRLELGFRMHYQLLTTGCNLE